MREIRPYGSEGGGAAALPTPILYPRGNRVPCLEAKRSENSRFLPLNGLK